MVTSKTNTIVGSHTEFPPEPVTATGFDSEPPRMPTGTGFSASGAMYR